jgi:hypothetical protein
MLLLSSERVRNVVVQKVFMVLSQYQRECVKWGVMDINSGTWLQRILKIETLEFNDDDDG